MTKATREEYEADLTRFARTGETKHYRSDKTAGTISLSEPGWVGDAVENEGADYIFASIKEKVGDLDSYPVDASDLLIYDNTPTAAPDLVKVAEAVRLKLRATPVRSATGRSFRAVSVIHDPVLIFDIEGACRTLSYKPEWGVA